MKKYKIYLLIMFIYVFTGCTVNYNIVFKADHTINENVVITESYDNLKDEYYTTDEIIDSKIESYKDFIKNNSFKYNVKKDSNSVEVTLNSNNKSVSKFTSFRYFGSMFNGADIEEKDNKYSFKTNGHYYQSGLFYDNKGVGAGLFVDTLNINIQFHNIVISSNADKVDKNTNTYTWTIDKNTKDKSIEFVLSNEINKDIYDASLYKNNSNDNYKYLIILIVGIGIIIGIICLIIINKQKNKI